MNSHPSPNLEQAIADGLLSLGYRLVASNWDSPYYKSFERVEESTVTKAYILLSRSDGEYPWYQFYLGIRVEELEVKVRSLTNSATISFSPFVICESLSDLAHSPARLCVGGPNSIQSHYPGEALQSVFTEIQTVGPTFFARNSDLHSIVRTAIEKESILTSRELLYKVPAAYQLMDLPDMAKKFLEERFRHTTNSDKSELAAYVKRLMAEGKLSEADRELLFRALETRTGPQRVTMLRNLGQTAYWNMSTANERVSFAHYYLQWLSEMYRPMRHVEHELTWVEKKEFVRYSSCEQCAFEWWTNNSPKFKSTDQKDSWIQTSICDALLLAQFAMTELPIPLQVSLIPENCDRELQIARQKAEDHFELQKRRAYRRTSI